MLATALVWVVERVVPALPSRLDGPLSEVAGTAAYLLSSGSRAAVRDNLAIVAPDRPDRERLVRRTFVNQVRHYLEIFRLVRLSPAAIIEEVRIIGWDTFERAHRAGRGVVLASAHVGPVSLCGQIFTARGMPLTMPIEKETSALVRSVNRARRAMGLRFVETESALGIGRVLRRGEILGILADRAVTGVGERVTFFGREALLPSAHVALALRSGAALVPAFARREGDRYVADLRPPIELERTGDQSEDVRRGVQAFARTLEREILRAPEEWSVFERIWDR